MIAYFQTRILCPRGGFGNLIALPLQHEPRKRGNTVFLDRNLQPCPDQWAYLATLQRISPASVDSVTPITANSEQTTRMPFRKSEKSEDTTPWEASLSAQSSVTLISDPIPKVINVVLAQRLFVEKAGLPSPLLNRIKRLAAFQNPEFYKKQRMRLSTALTPRVISCAEELSHHIVLPRGCTEDLASLLQEYNSTIKIDDQRNSGESLNVKFKGELTSVQQQAVNAILKHDMGVLVAPPGSGKTVVGNYLVAQRKCNTLVLVHRRALLDQWKAQLSLFLDLKTNEIGTIGGGKRKPNGNIDVAMIQSLVHKNNVDELIANYGHIIVDECHHLPAVSFERVLSAAKPRYITGLTATPKRRDGHHPIITMQLGPVRFTIDSKNQAELRPFKHQLIIRDTTFTLPDEKESLSIQELYSLLATNEERNDMIFNDILNSLEQERSPIVLTERKEHLDYFAQRLGKFTRNLIVLHGGRTTKQRAEQLEKLSAISDSEERLVLATGRYIGEGFDDARLDTLFLALPISWKGTLVQYTGRLHRIHPNKSDVRIFDYVDHMIPMLNKMFEKRLRGYSAIGYTTSNEQSKNP